MKNAVDDQFLVLEVHFGKLLKRSGREIQRTGGNTMNDHFGDGS